MFNNIFDTHAHYTDEAFDSDRDELIKKIHDNGVKYIMLPSVDLKDSENSLNLSLKYDFVYCAVGVHPENLDAPLLNYIEILKNTSLKNRDKVKAIGEIGLDYHYDGYDRKKMMDVFASQIDLANELKLPVIIHSRDALADTMDILKAHRPEKGVVHCFSGSAETAKEYLNMGLNISFTGVLTFKNARKALEALAVIPDDRFMLETDSPYMAPVPYRGERCDSSMIPLIAEKAAEIKQTSVQNILDITCKNAEAFFNI